MDQFPIYIVLALWAAVIQPPVNRIAINAGPHFSHYEEERYRTLTAGVSAITHGSLELGIAYTRRGYDDTICAPKPRTDSHAAMDFGGVPPCFHGVQHFHRQVNYIDAKILWREEVAATDRYALNLAFGGLAGFVVNCLNEPLDAYPVGECRTKDDDLIASLVIGGGVTVPVVRQFDFTLDLQYAYELDFTATEYPMSSVKARYRTTSLIAGLAYRR